MKKKQMKQELKWNEKSIIRQEKKIEGLETELYKNRRRQQRITTFIKQLLLILFLLLLVLSLVKWLIT